MKKDHSLQQLSFLENVYLLKDIPVEYLEIILKSLHLKNYQKGEAIIREGEEGHSMFVLLEGKVSITKRMTLFDDHHGRGQLDKTIIKLKDSDYAFFGEMSLCGDTEVRSATVTAEADCLLGELTAATIRQMVKDHQDFGTIFFQNLSIVLADRLRKANRDVLKLTTALTLALEE
jgi:CRP-like cAMP-binding protein